VHTLLAQQLAKARLPDGEMDLEALEALVAAAYAEANHDRSRADRSIAAMLEQLDRLNRELERQVAERTADLREREQDLQEQNHRFDAAINNMSQGLLLFDPNDRLVICNRRYIEMYGLAPDRVRPGLTVRELLQLRVDNGTFAGSIEQYIDDLRAILAEQRTTSRVVELADGRTMAVVRHPMPDGCWVTTHEDITERRRAEKQIAHMARHDALTDLPNRVLLRERLAQALARVPRGERLAVLYIDLDHFKTVNDTLGHPVGDDLLKAVARRLLDCVRDTDTVARVGGDEFAIIQVAIEAPNDAAILARRLCDAIRSPYEINGHAVIADTSVGIALAPDDGVEPNDLLRNADMALYRAKADGRGIYRFFEPEMDARMQARRMLELALRNALPNQEFEIHYQPLIDLARGEITGFEALIRWNHPERGLISPVEFIPVAEDIGLIVLIGEWVIRRACADAASWPDRIKIAINLSPTQLLSANLVPTVMGALASSGLAPGRLEIEITEAVLIHATEATLATLHRLRGLGVNISMDDFGTGYSSLRHLRSFPFDKIKIDRCFIKDLGAGDGSAAIIQAVTGLARSLNMATTAEGVETEEQLRHVRSLGCTQMQGFLFSPPVKPGEIPRLLGLASGGKRAAG
jgi:diguanylate cyclase (GGDEF)-like protein/PAS domain S-box-containing protein